MRPRPCEVNLAADVLCDVSEAPANELLGAGRAAFSP